MKTTARIKITQKHREIYFTEKGYMSSDDCIRNWLMWQSKLKQRDGKKKWRYYGN